MGINTGGGGGAGSAAGVGGRVLLARGRISVPQDLVGKIIGTQGSIITTIQKDTGTEIKSPPKEAGRGPNATADFEISAYQALGLTSAQAAEMRVQQAKQLIGHLVMRQLERRTSDDLVDDASSMVMLDGLQPPHWMWPDVTQMESSEAREVLDRILAESKNKTRRAKEMAGGSSSTPNTPGGPNSSGGSQTPDVFCEAAIIDPILSHHIHGSSMVRTLSHSMSGPGKYIFFF
ncbi:hypothetical protein Ciccas_000715 [Cichlidogyrus casuarinus]|uniref:K Homology domain-containing protein n=1 Tax=Cichlidogyrus casuarinus TaxID=1844966 RepID=A0ABD2QMJ5_9PLAT